tara:strand:+ start:617 stop:1081 length:465 start_codon:yes stop_codon:yes gene_type:complete
MYIAKVTDGIIGEIVYYTKIFRNIPNDELLAERGYKKINNYKQHNILTEKLSNTAPYVSGSYVFTVSVDDLSTDEVKASKDSAMAQIRQTRDSMLQETDWYAIRKSETGTDMPTATATYRQALRDIPTKIGSDDPRTWDSYPSLSLDGSSASGV